MLFLLTDDGARPSRRCARWLTSIAFGAFLVCPLVGRAQEASAPSIVEASAEELFELGELEAAREAYERSIEAGGNSPESLALAYRRLGILAAIVNDSEQATQWFERSLVIDAMQQAPEALAPSQRTLFVSIQERRRGESAELLLTHEAELGHARLQVVPRGLPSGWVHHYRARAGSWSGESEAGTFRLGDDAFGDDAFGDDAVGGATADVSVEVAALDEHGNVLLRASSRITRRTQMPMPVETPSRRGLWIGLSVVAVAAVAAAIILPLALSKDDTSYGMPVIEWP